MKVLALVCLLLALPAHAQIPQAAQRYKVELTRQARLIWGLNAPLAVMAAQIHQESAWQVGARSAVGAQGLAQFMPATAQWIATQDSQLAPANTLNPRWALRALARYDHWLYQRLVAETPCDKWAFTLAAYNGGLGWVLKDKTLAQQQGANRNRWFNQVARFNAGRSAANFAENRTYPQRILLTLTPRYSQAGWGQGVCHAH